MKGLLESFPFPARSELPEGEIFSYGYQKNNFKELENEYNRKISQQASAIKNQYLAIEQIIINSFEYVQPSLKNRQTTSARFATIIRESSVLFEILSRMIYTNLFTVQKNTKLDITNFLSLDAFINLRDYVLFAPLLQQEFSTTDILQPFKSLELWDRNSLISGEYIPRWWKSYNKLKHDLLGFEKAATFENALLSLGAAYIIITRIWGNGVVGGRLEKPLSGNAVSTTFSYQSVPVSQLFIEDSDFKTISIFG